MYSEKVKLFLCKKLQESEMKINQIKKNRTSVVVSVILSTGVAAVITLLKLPLHTLHKSVHTL